MKFPSTPHLPGSKYTSDDKLLPDSFTWSEDVIATEKMDGSNIMINNKKFITRSGKISAADWTWPARIVQQTNGILLPKGIWLAGELLHWRKSISYTDLPGPFMVFGAVKGNLVLSWEDVVELADSVNLPVVPVLAGPGPAKTVIDEAKTKITESKEGFVIRPVASFSLPHYEQNVGKWVGEHHNPVATNTGVNGIANA